MLIEIRSEAGQFSQGHRITIDGNEGDWHYGPADRTTISLMERHIVAHSKTGGQIINYDTGYKRKPKMIYVPPCPTAHARISDDFMGGSVCLDCRAVW